jgi:hypothetical protein
LAVAGLQLYLNPKQSNLATALCTPNSLALIP